MNLSPRLQMATQIAAALASTASRRRNPDQIADEAFELTDALIERAGQEWQDVINPGDERAMDSARTS